jgi:hypothetical protein
VNRKELREAAPLYAGVTVMVGTVLVAELFHTDRLLSALVGVCLSFAAAAVTAWFTHKPER